MFRDSRADQIYARFKEFHAANPGVWRLFVRFSIEACHAGRKRYSARCVMERIRWHVDVETRGAGVELKLNDHYAPYYARMFQAKFPHRPLYETRQRTSVQRPAYETDLAVFHVWPPGSEESLYEELRRL
jgi:hypothetical protein